MSLVVPASHRELQQENKCPFFVVVETVKVSLGWMETLCPSLRAPFVSPSPWSRAADARDPQSLSRQQKLSSCLISCCLISLRDGQVIGRCKNPQGTLIPMPGGQEPWQGG